MPCVSQRRRLSRTLLAGEQHMNEDCGSPAAQDRMAHRKRNAYQPAEQVIIIRACRTTRASLECIKRINDGSTPAESIRCRMLELRLIFAKAPAAFFCTRCGKVSTHWTAVSMQASFTAVTRARTGDCTSSASFSGLIAPASTRASENSIAMENSARQAFCDKRTRG